tara:strand:- start:90 stop:1466 length:1377 start_codon:yes stop_codon:yes gene_type:complete
MAENLYDIPTAPRRTGREFFGDIREGFTAGLVGRDPRFSREEKQKSLTQATLQDAEEIKRALNSNDMRKATDILVDRANLLEGMGESAEDTYALRDMIVSGNTPAALGEIDTFINAATRRGLIQAPSPIESKYVSRDAQGRLGTVVPVAGGGTRFEPSTGATAKPVEPTEYGTYTSDGIERYSDGPYAGYSLGKVAEMQRTGQLGKFGDVMPSMTSRAAAPAPEVRPPMLMTTPPAASAPDLYAGLSTQEAAILQSEQDQLGLERERAAAEEDRREQKASREKTTFEQEAKESERMQEAIKAEMLQVVGITNKLLNPSVYSDKVFEASTGAYEGGNPLFGAAMTLGADYQDVTNFTNDISYLQDLSTLENLGRMTGVLSESDIMLLRQAATGINLKSDANELKLKLRDLNDKIVEKLGGMGFSAEEIQSSSMQYSGGALDEAIDRINSRQRQRTRGPR